MGSQSHWRCPNCKREAYHTENEITMAGVPRESRGESWSCYSCKEIIHHHTIDKTITYSHALPDEVEKAHKGLRREEIYEDHFDDCACKTPDRRPLFVDDKPPRCPACLRQMEMTLFLNID